MSTRSQRRFNPLTREWVLVSSGRLSRPWTGEVAKAQAPETRKNFDESCPLCPGVERANAQTNPDYKGIYVFPNDFPAIGPSSQEQTLTADHDLFVEQQEIGVCKVFCFSEDHSKTLALMTQEEATAVMMALREESVEIASDSKIRHILPFENRGPMMGCSNPHPHGQIWAQSGVPSIPAKETDAMRAHWDKHATNLLQSYLAEERQRRDRIVIDNGAFAAIVPFWATWPFETIVIPHRHIAWLSDLTDRDCAAFADIVRRMAIKYDNLFQTDCPYSAGIHQQVVNVPRDESYQLHMHFYPPLLRSATIKKFMVGYEMLAEPQRDLSPEEAAQRLRECPDTHYLDSQ